MNVHKVPASATLTIGHGTVMFATERRRMANIR